jgi:hypothetical protein
MTAMHKSRDGGNFITVHYNNCSTLLLTIIVNFPLYLIYKLNFVRYLCVGKNYIYIGLCTGFHSGLEMYPLWIRGTLQMRKQILRKMTGLTQGHHLIEQSRV